VAADLARHEIPVADGDTPDVLRDRLNERYLEEVRALKARLAAGEFPLQEYAGRAEALKERFTLLGLPLPLWTEPAPGPARD
jgi:hypothetical protein